jgi:hypothetical protein
MCIGGWQMEYAPLLSGLIGALIGSAASVATTLILSNAQTKREMKKLAIEVALKDFITRVEDKSGALPRHPVVILINYYDKVIDLIKRNKLTPREHTGAYAGTG